MSDPKSAAIRNHYDIPRVHLKPQAFEGDLEGLRRGLEVIQDNLGANPSRELFEAARDELLVLAETTGLNTANINDFEKKSPLLADLFYDVLTRIADGLFKAMETGQAMQLLARFAAVNNGDITAYDPVRIEDLQPIPTLECAYTGITDSLVESQFRKLLNGLWEPALACSGVPACENPVEFSFDLKVRRDAKSNEISLEGADRNFERLDVDVFCGINPRETRRLARGPEGQFQSGAIAQCADNAMMALRWRATHPKWCRTGMGAAIIPPRFDPKMFAKRPHVVAEVKIPEFIKDIFEPILMEDEIHKFQWVFLVDASSSMDDDIEAFSVLLDEIVAILQSQAEDTGDVEIGLWHVAGGYYEPFYARDLPLQSKRQGGNFQGIVTEAFNQVIAGLGGGTEPLWAALKRILSGEDWDSGSGVHRKIVVLSDEWGDAGKNTEPLEVAKLAEQKGVEIKIRGPSAVVYEVARLVQKGEIPLRDYHETVVGDGETGIYYSSFERILKGLEPLAQQRLSALYESYAGGSLGDITLSPTRIDMAAAVLDSEDEKIRLQTLRATIVLFEKKGDPEYFDLIATYLTDEEAVIRKEAALFFAKTKIPPSLRQKYLGHLEKRLKDEDKEVRAAAIQAIYQITKETFSSREREKRADQIAAMLGDRQETVRKAAIHALGELVLTFKERETQSRYAALVIAAVHDPSDAVGKAAVRTLGRLIPVVPDAGLKGRCSEGVAAALADLSPEIRKTARSVLFRVREEFSHENLQFKIAGALMRNFDGDESSKNTLGVYYHRLSEEGQKRITSLAVQYLDHPNASVRRSAIGALAMMAESDTPTKRLVVTGKVLKHLEDKDVVVREAAFYSSQKLLWQIAREGFRLDDTFAEASMDEKEAMVRTAGVLVPTCPDPYHRYQFCKFLADEFNLGDLKDERLEKYQQAVLGALQNILPTLDADQAERFIKKINFPIAINPAQATGEAASVLTRPAGVTIRETEAADPKGPPLPLKAGFNPREYFKERPAGEPLAVNHGFVHYFSRRPWAEARRDLQGLSTKPAPTEEAWMCVAGQTPAGEASHCYEVGISETPYSTKPYFSSEFTHGIQEEFSRVDEIGLHHFHPKPSREEHTTEYPSDIDLMFFLQQALVYREMGYPEGAYAGKIITAAGEYVIRPNFKKIGENPFGLTNQVIIPYVMTLLPYFQGADPSLRNLSQAEKCARFAQEVTRRISPYVEITFEPIRAEAKR